MASTSPTELAAGILRLCLEGKKVPDQALAPLAEMAAGEGLEAEAASRALFAGIVEPLADRFEPALSEAYVDLFSRILELGGYGFNAAELKERHGRVFAPRHYEEGAGQVERVCVLSRVTLGADVAVTSIVLDAAKRRFPDAETCLVGNRKSWELFAADSRINHLEARYVRTGTLRERLKSGLALEAELSRPGTIVIDPDSRLTQLGLLPVCPEENYYFFESRSYGGDSGDTLGQLVKRWVAETFGVVDALPYIAPLGPGAPPATGEITVSLGVGENPEKRVSDAFEAGLLRRLAATDPPLLVDQGAGGEEAQRVERAIEASGAKPGRIQTWDGAFAPFADRIRRSRLYVGYDSAGQHVAAACGVPLVSIFAGFPTERFFKRWQPAGTAPVAIVKAEDRSDEQLLAETWSAVERFLRDSG